MRRITTYLKQCIGFMPQCLCKFHYIFHNIKFTSPSRILLDTVGWIQQFGDSALCDLNNIFAYHLCMVHIFARCVWMMISECTLKLNMKLK